jgi:cell shape-determining protein MreC
MIDELKETFQKKNMSTANENESLKEKLLEKNILNEKLQAKVDENLEDLTDFKEWKSDIMR